MGYVYILKSLKNNTFYIGSTDDLARRLQEHKSGQSPYTKNILPVEIVFSQAYNSSEEAHRIELWLKKQKNRTLIEQIVKDQRIAKFFV